ncbi:MAG: alpha/beta fold hydrolase [Terriglobales bacterium]
MRFPPPGRLVDVGGHRLHVRMVPAKAADTRAESRAPTLVLDAALGGSSLGWVLVERGLQGRFPLLCYDRAGLGWSESGPLPCTLDGMVAELERLLELAPGPLLLAGHSFGALVVHGYAAQHRERVVGMVLVDPPALEEWAQPDAEHRARLETGIRLARRGVWAARCGLAQAVAWMVGTGAFRLAAASARAVSGGKLRTQADFNFTPAAKLPSELKPVMRYFWSRARFYRALAAQMEALPAAARQVAALPPLLDLPLAVLSASDAPPEQAAEHARCAAQSRRGVHLTARASGHWIPLEEPELVIEAIGLVASAVL